MRLTQTILILILLIVLSVACRRDTRRTPIPPQSAQVVTTTPLPTATDVPTAAPTATNTPLPPTNTPLPTATPIPPTATPLPPTPTLIPTAVPPTIAPPAAPTEPAAVIITEQTIAVTESDVLQIVIALADQQGLPLSDDTQVDIANGTINVRDELSFFGQKFVTEVIARPSVSNNIVAIAVERAVSANVNLPQDVVSQIRVSVEQSIMAELRNVYGCNEIVTIAAENGTLSATCR